MHGEESIQTIYRARMRTGTLGMRNCWIITDHNNLSASSRERCVVLEVVRVEAKAAVRKRTRDRAHMLSVE